jgi:hypothetical protein
VSTSLRAEINRYYRQADQAAQTPKERKGLAKFQSELADLNGRVSQLR